MHKLWYQRIPTHQEDQASPLIDTVFAVYHDVSQGILLIGYLMAEGAFIDKKSYPCLINLNIVFFNLIIPTILSHR